MYILWMNDNTGHAADCSQLSPRTSSTAAVICALKCFERSSSGRPESETARFYSRVTLVTCVVSMKKHQFTNGEVNDGKDAVEQATGSAQCIIASNSVLTHFVSEEKEAVEEKSTAAECASSITIVESRSAYTQNFLKQKSQQN